MLEHHGAFADHVLVVVDAVLHLAKQLLQLGLPLSERLGANVVAVEFKQIEGAERDRVVIRPGMQPVEDR